ncbi:hypothetical protein NDA14_005734 [Ustilago hordei]|nr:hypothetical protein NDA14_005734 [Ustilago hordei]
MPSPRRHWWLHWNYSELLASICTSQVPTVAAQLAPHPSPVFAPPQPPSHLMGFDLAVSQPIAPAGESPPLSMSCSFAWVLVEVVLLIERDQLKLEHLVKLHNPESHVSCEASCSTGLTLTDRQLSMVNNVRGLMPETQVIMMPRTGVSVDDDEVDGVGDKVGGVNTSVQCVDLMLEVIPRLQWTTAFGSIYIWTANLLWGTFRHQRVPSSSSTVQGASPACCHGPGCSRSRRVTGSYGQSTGIEDLVDTSREHGRSAVSMETMDSYGFTCKGALSPYARRTRHSHEEDQAQRAGAAMRRTKLRWLPLRGSRDRNSVEGVDTGHEEEEQCRRSRHRS